MFITHARKNDHGECYRKSINAYDRIATRAPGISAIARGAWRQPCMAPSLLVGAVRCFSSNHPRFLGIFLEARFARQQTSFRLRFPEV